MKLTLILIVILIVSVFTFEIKKQNILLSKFLNRQSNKNVKADDTTQIIKILQSTVAKKALKKSFNQISAIPFQQANYTTQFNKYSIFHFDTLFLYQDQNQTMNVDKNGLFINLTNGVANMKSNFTWEKLGQKRNLGFGTITFSSKLNLTVYYNSQSGSFIQKTLNYPCYKLDLSNIKVSLNETLYPPTNEDLSILQQMVTNKSVQGAFINRLSEINEALCRIFDFYFDQQYAPMFGYSPFSYKWEDPYKNKKDLVIRFQIYSQNYFIDDTYVNLNFKTVVSGFLQDYKLNNKISPYFNNVETSNFTQFDLTKLNFFERLLKYAIYQGQMSTNLTKKNWQTSMFHFIANDLKDIIPDATSSFDPSAQVIGSCSALSDVISIQGLNNDPSNKRFNVSFNNNCNLNINKIKVLDFVIEIKFIIQASIMKDQYNNARINFNIRGHQQDVKFFDQPYKVQNKDLAINIISKSIDLLLNQKVIGSNWETQIYNRKPLNYDIRVDQQNLIILYEYQR